MKKGLLTSFFVLVALAVITLAANPPGEFAPINILGLEKIALPEEWLCTWCDEEKIVEPDWTYTEAEDWEYEWYAGASSSKNPKDTMFMGIWEINNVSGWIEIIVENYKHPVNADLEYFLSDPVKIYRKSNWNFVYEKEDIVPSDWDFINLEADEDAVLCGGGDQSECAGWYYHARYKQYYLLVHSTVISDSATFERMVEAITAHFSEEIIR